MNTADSRHLVLARFPSMHSVTAFRLDLRALFRNFARMLGVQLLTAAIQLAIVALIAKEYGPRGSGVYVVSLLLPTLLATFLNLGANSSNVYYLGAGRFPVQTIWKTSWTLIRVLGLAGLLLGAGVILFKAEDYFPGIGRPVLWVALLAFPFSLAQGFLNSLFQGLQDFRRLNLCMLAQPALTLGGIAVLVAAGQTEVLAPVCANLAGAAGGVAFSWLLLRKHLRSEEPDSHSGYMDKALRYGFKAYLSNLLTFLQSRADTFLINMLINPAAAGIYSIAFQIGEKLWMLSQAVSVVLLPKLSAMSKEEERRIQITTAISRMVFAVSAAGAVLLGILAYPLILVLFGATYRPSYVPFILLLPGMIALAPARVIANDIAARGKPELNLYMALAGVVLTITGNLIVLPHLGIHGAAIVTSAAYILDLLMKILTYRAITKAPFFSLVLMRRNDVRDVVGAFKPS
ncbi:flippase [Noviherbaspirillum sp. UKPF54]|uniref:flippase n=1 Tax=Noviherbaspirillum sp. UKPF54 TaxID=2601898 RepID=UPI00143D53B3|nr:flippase [Noviherbaspirillum sp. UKPF54]